MAKLNEKHGLRGLGRGTLAAALTALLLAAPDVALVQEAREALGVPGADEAARPARRAGVGFEFRRKLAILDNPYCDIRTYILPDFPEQASSTQTADNRSVIVIDASTLKFDRPYAHFLLAHECCHHTLGHTRLTTQRSGGLGVQPFYYLRPMLKNMELDADACAVRMLKLTKELGAIERARVRMQEHGHVPTGAYYPTGNERTGNIVREAEGN